MPYVNDKAIHNAKNEYVCWIDIMGTKTKMENSVRTCSIFIFKFHAAILEAMKNIKDDSVKIYPVMDGAYLTSTTFEDLKKVLITVFQDLADEFIKEKKFFCKFLIKASIAYGPIIHGCDVDDNINDDIALNKNYKNSLLLGLPMIQAYMGEPKAPPFGVFIHESARAFCPQGEKPLTYKWWQWYYPAYNEKKDELQKSIDEYFKNCRNRSISIDYSLDRIDEHRKAAEEYFSDVE